MGRNLATSAVSHTRRRHVLYVLRRRGKPMAIGELTEQVHGLNHEATLGGVESSIHSLHDGLVDVHLPALERTGFVTYDPGTGIVKLERDDTSFRVLLDLAWNFETRSR